VADAFGVTFFFQTPGGSRENVTRTQGTKPDSADFLRNQRLTPLAPTRERVIFRKAAGTVVDFVAGEPFFSGKAGRVTIHDA
jgi:hypothetical protein